MPQRYLSPHKSILHWKVAFNTATEFETSLFTDWVKDDPDFSFKVSDLHTLLLDQGLRWEAVRIRVAIHRINAGEPLPPRGLPLVLGDESPSKAAPPFDSLDVEVMEVSEGGEHYYQMRKGGGQWHRRTAQQLWPRGRQATAAAKNPTMAGQPLRSSASVSASVSAVDEAADSAAAVAAFLCQSDEITERFSNLGTSRADRVDGVRDAARRGESSRGKDRRASSCRIS